MTRKATLRQKKKRYLFCEKDAYVAGDRGPQVGKGWTARQFHGLPLLLEVIVQVLAGVHREVKKKCLAVFPPGSVFLIARKHLAHSYSSSRSATWAGP